jgi:hypothetical protein
MNQEIFEELYNDREIRKLFMSMSRKNINNCPTTLYDCDDLLSVAYIEMWRSIINYKFICPICHIRALTEKAYKKHMKKKHKKYLEPDPTISKYVLYNVGVYLQNRIRDEYNIKRMSNHSFNQINLFSPEEEDDIKSKREIEYSEYLIQQDSDFQDEIMFKVLVDDVLKDEDEITKDIFNAYIKGYRKSDIAEDLYKKGIYLTKQSAAVIVSRKIRDIISKFSNKINK